MKERRKILFLQDNCTAHPGLHTLHNIRFEFLPANTTSLIQPMDQGVIKNRKTYYRKKLGQMTIAAIEDSLVSTTSTVTNVSFQGDKAGCNTLCSQKLAAGEGSDYSQLLQKRWLSSGDSIKGGHRKQRSHATRG